MPSTVYDLIAVKATLNPGTRTNGTANGTAVNLGSLGSDSGELLILTGTVTDGSHAFALEESDTGSGGWSAIPAGRLQGSVPTVTSANSNTVYEVGFLSAKAFVRATATTTGATTGGVFTAVVIAGSSDQTPISHA